MSTYNVEVVAKNSCSGVGEGPHWDELNQVLWYVDFQSDHGHVIRHDPTNNTYKSYRTPKTVSFVIPHESNTAEHTELVTGQIHDVVNFRWENPEENQLIAQVEADLPTRLNDAKCDARGRLWMGSLALDMDLKTITPHGIASLYCIDNDKSLRLIHDDVNLSNGFAWSSDNRTMFYIDSCARVVYAYDFDLDAGTAKNRRVAIDFAKFLPTKNYGLPDGMTIDQAGKLWIACFSASRVMKWDPEAGQPLDEIVFPCTNMTSCTFGGRDYKEMYVTNSIVGLTEEQLKHEQPLAGSLFKVTGFSTGGQKTSGFVPK